MIDLPPKLTPEEVTRLKAAPPRITIYDVWKMLALPGWKRLPADHSCDHCELSPLRKESHASFSIFDNGRRWKDHGGGNDACGDAVDFLEAAIGVSREIASRLVIGIANIKHGEPVKTRPQYDPFTDEAKVAERSHWPAFEVPSEDDINAIAELRSLSPEGVQLAARRGMLYCANAQEGRAWIVTDSRRYLAQARRIDGKSWPRIGDKKAWTLAGSIGTWPIGIEEAFNFPAIALVEGGPDLLAAFHCVWAAGRDEEIAPVVILGAGMEIRPQALPGFVGTSVKIFQHEDESGRAGARMWARQLRSAGVKATGYSFAGLTLPDGSPVKDLNEFVRIMPANPTQEQIENTASLLQDAFTFTTAK